MEEILSTVIGVEPDAREFIRARGGAVYVWVTRSGFMKVGFKRPEDIDFVELRGDGFSLFQDRMVFPPKPDLGWHVSLRRLPWRRIKVEYASPELHAGVNWIEVLLSAPWP